ncbi:hypothetical protein NQ318_022937 [Aromia moschata]|uniref:Uncharacterized protein n=1 Tax=Aromia moschata TaxID=1265417 RepID=A0AAV8XCC8_9CUCU|nr:hypothetical protein NQ318_022937 [Aromia moschata]
MCDENPHEIFEDRFQHQFSLNVWDCGPWFAPLETLGDLRNRIIAGCNSIRNDPDVFEKVCQSMKRKLDSYIRAGGGHFKHFL